jgi:hypothetical protein
MTTATELTELEITPDETESGEISAGHLSAAVEALKIDGIVILKNAVDLTHIEALRERMLEDLKTILARGDCPYNFTESNVQQDPPPFPPYLFKDVLLNEIVIAITRAMLGPGLKNSFYSGNTALPSGLRQPVHPDTAQLWRGLDAPSPPFAFVINVPVMDVTVENGATEIWPGSHHDTTVSIFDRDLGLDGLVPEEALERRRAFAPPVYPSLKAGSIVIRDMRLWHAGMPNRTDTARPMIAMIHYIKWWGACEPIPFPKGTEAFFRHPALRTNALFVDGPVEYLKHHKRAKRPAKPSNPMQ